MSCIKRTPADIAFSRCVRYRAGYQCQRCGAQHDESSMGLHCSHVHGRRSWSVRFHPENAFALCYGCHSYLGGQPHEHEQFAISLMGPGRYEMLLDIKRSVALGKIYRITDGRGPIAKHYRDELARMIRTGIRQFEAWQ